MGQALKLEYAGLKGRVMASIPKLERISIDPRRVGGRPCIRGTRIEVAIVLDALDEGLTPAQICEHYPALKDADVRAAIAYAAELTRETVWKLDNT